MNKVQVWVPVDLIEDPCEHNYVVKPVEFTPENPGIPKHKFSVPSMGEWRKATIIFEEE